MAVMLLDASLDRGEHIDLDLSDYIDLEYPSEWKVLSRTLFRSYPKVEPYSQS